MLVLLQKMALHFQQETPFVAYRKPGEKIVKTLMQQTDEKFTTLDFAEKGFVFAPFDSENQALFIPLAESEYFETTFEPLNLEGNFLKQEEETRQVEKNYHLNLVKNGIDAIANGKMEKVVLARQYAVEYPDYDSWLIFERLLQKYPEAFVYAWFHPKSGLWMGATPESLLHIESDHLKTMALAGTKNNVKGKEIIWGEKEKREQAYVTDFIVEQLKPTLANMNISATENSAAGNLWHLKTNISGDLEHGELKKVVEALHPTPAVCGIPRDVARKFIKENENFHREFYTGFLGEVNMDKKIERAITNRNPENKAYRSLKPVTDLYVNLRCMKFGKDSVHVFAGGGITAESDPESEWQETVHKLQTMLKVL